MHIRRSDIRDVIRELKLIETSNQNKAYAFREQETLVEQTQALFFTDSVTKVEPKFLQDFLIVLMSSRSDSSQKITVMQQILK